MFKISEHDEAEKDFMLFEEIESQQRLPKHLKQMLTNVPLASETSDIFCASILYLLLEMGFVVCDSSQSPPDDDSLSTSCSYSYVENILEKYVLMISNSIKNQLSCGNGKTSETFKFSIRLINFSENVLNLVVRKIFDKGTLCITFCYNENSCSILLNVNEYVRDPVIIDEDLLENPAQYFKNTLDLAYKIRSTLIIPIRNAVMLDEGHTFPGLFGIPREIQWHILKMLDLQSLQSLSQTCIKLRCDIITYVNERNMRITTERRSTPIIRLPSNLFHNFGDKICKSIFFLRRR